MEIEAGSWSGGDYNYGYNGMLKEAIGDDISHTHFRNLSVGDFVGWWSPDPMEFKYPNSSPYVAMGNNPIMFIDPMGDDIFDDIGEGISNAIDAVSDWWSGTEASPLKPATEGVKENFDWLTGGSGSQGNILSESFQAEELLREFHNIPDDANSLSILGSQIQNTKVEYKEEFELIQSGIEATIDVGLWTPAAPIFDAGIYFGYLQHSTYLKADAEIGLMMAPLAFVPAGNLAKKGAKVLKNVPVNQIFRVSNNVIIPKGFKLTKEFGYQHGQKVYSFKNKFYSLDVDSHIGGTWKVFIKKNGKLKRIGKADENLKIIGK